MEWSKPDFFDVADGGCVIGLVVVAVGLVPDAAVDVVVTDGEEALFNLKSWLFDFDVMYDVSFSSAGGGRPAAVVGLSIFEVVVMCSRYR
ncbi:unnamed protein product [Ambrosiozyma monospora]|uniref:Unnamed protein product n=1 Tax=Ambrosiozyma monospora TaxID=43982 RepID=A0ACB5UBG8_AMBMO|nr:unnamed protein product [Ambrosiozyma monospora]